MLRSGCFLNIFREKGESKILKEISDMNIMRSYIDDFPYDEYRDILKAAFLNNKTVFFLDTSFLNRLLFYPDGVREKLFSWMKDFKERIIIPYWVYMEYMKRAINGSELNKLNPFASYKISNQLKGMKDVLYPYLDDKIAERASFENREDLKSELMDIIAKMEKIEKVEPNCLETHKKISELFFPNSVLPKVENLESLKKVFDIRCENKIPPGFDERKTSNIYGDFVIWNEILNKQKSADGDAVFVTEDVKKDWMYSPQKMIINGRLLPNENNRLKITNPQLCLEYYQNTKEKHFFAISLPDLIWCLKEADPDKYHSLENFANYENYILGSFEKAKKEICLPKKQNLMANSKNKQGLCYSNRVLQDAAYSINNNTTIGKCIELLKTYNWYDQSSGLDLFKRNINRIKNSSKDDLFVLGRNIYQAACGKEWNSLAYIRNLSSNVMQLTDDMGDNHLLNGMLYEVFFDKFGEMRKFCKGNYISCLYEAVERISSSFSFLKETMKEYGDHFLWNFGDDEIRFVAKGENVVENEKEVYEIYSLNCAGKELLREYDDRFSIDLPYCMLNGAMFCILPKGPHYMSFRHALAHVFLLPEKRMKLLMEPESSAKIIALKSKYCIDWELGYHLNNAQFD